MSSLRFSIADRNADFSLNCRLKTIFYTQSENELYIKYYLEKQMYNYGRQEHKNDMPLYPLHHYPFIRQAPTPPPLPSIETLRAQSDYLLQEMREMKHLLQEFMGQVKQTLVNLSQSLENLQRAAEGGRVKKKFKKAIACPYEDCDRRYSSKIALNCHIRMKHRLQKQ